MENRAVWAELLTQVLQSSLEVHSGPIPGARIGNLLPAAAEKAGLVYPPEPGLKLKDFLHLFPEIARVVQRKGKDFLVVPVDHPELFARMPGPTLIRRDLFTALTRVNELKNPWYATNEDRVVWYPKDTPPEGDQWVAFPERTLSSEIDLRHTFVDQIEASEVAEQLRIALAGRDPFRNFTRAANQAGVLSNWQAFFTGNVLQRLAEWAGEERLEWRNDWISSTSETPEKPVQQLPPSTTTLPSALPENLVRVLAASSEADLARVMVPMDLVLRWIAKIS